MGLREKVKKRKEKRMQEEKNKPQPEKDLYGLLGLGEVRQEASIADIKSGALFLRSVFLGWVALQCLRAVGFGVYSRLDSTIVTSVFRRAL